MIDSTEVVADLRDVIVKVSNLTIVHGTVGSTFLNLKLSKFKSERLKQSDFSTVWAQYCNELKLEMVSDYSFRQKRTAWLMLVLSNKFAFETLCILLFMWWAHCLIDAVRLKFRMPWILFDIFQNYKPLDAKILVRDKSQWVAVVGRHYQWLLLPQQPNIHNTRCVAALEILHQPWRNTLRANRRICICSTAHKNRRGRGGATTNCNDPFARSTQLAACARINIAKTHQQYHPHCHCHGYILYITYSI